MKRLIKSDLYRIIKSKLFIIILIIACALPLLQAALTLGVAKGLGLLGAESEDVITALSLDGVSSLSGIFSIGNDIGLILPIFCGILVCNDANNGTLRNKIISGNSKTKIYFSHLITSIIFNVVIISITAFFSFVFFGLFFGFSGYGSLEARQIILWLVIGLLTYILMASFTTFLADTSKNMAPTIIFTLVLSFVSALIGTLLIILEPERELLVNLFPFLPSLKGFNMSDTNFFMGLGTLSFFIILNTSLGLLLFNKKDIK